VRWNGQITAVAVAAAVTVVVCCHVEQLLEEEDVIVALHNWFVLPSHAMTDALHHQSINTASRYGN